MINESDLNKSSNNLENSKFLENSKEKKIILKHINNGLSKGLIIWIIYKQRIHGYGIMKELDKFFKLQIDEGLMNNTSPSKIYPMLQKLEEKGIIIGEWETHNNKKVKFYEITEKGKYLLNHMRIKIQKMYNTPLCAEFVEFMFYDSWEEEK